MTAKDLTPGDRERLNGRVRSIVQKSAHTNEDLANEIRAVARLR